MAKPLKTQCFQGIKSDGVRPVLNSIFRNRLDAITKHLVRLEIQHNQ